MLNYQRVKLNDLPCGECPGKVADVSGRNVWAKSDPLRLWFHKNNTWDTHGMTMGCMYIYIYILIQMVFPLVN